MVVCQQVVGVVMCIRDKCERVFALCCILLHAGEHPECGAAGVSTATGALTVTATTQLACQCSTQNKKQQCQC